MKRVISILDVCRMWTEGLSFSEIRSRVKIGNGTIAKYRDCFRSSGLTLNQLQTMEAGEVIDLFYPKKPESKRPLPDFEQVYKRVTASCARTNLQVEWENYLAENPNGYKYTQFCRKFNEWCSINRSARNLTMAMNRVPGEYIFIDWLCQGLHNQSYEKRKVMRRG